MEVYQNRNGEAVNHPWVLFVLVLFFLVFGALSLMQGLSVVLLPFLFGIPATDAMLLMTGNYDHDHARMAVLFIQALSGGAFLLGGWLFIRFVDKKSIRLPLQFARVKLSGVLILVTLTIGFIMFNSLFVSLNMNINFPPFLSGFEKVLRTQEDKLMELTLYTTDFENVGEFIVGILVIGILASIGEEYLFRGILQPKIHGYTGNVHLGIWISAFVFSAIHMQFFGFLPRLILGAFLGYLYVFSGSLIYPIIAHFLNNAFIVLMFYLLKLGVVDSSILEATTIYWPYVGIGLIVSWISGRYFIRMHSDFYGRNNENNDLLS